MASETYNFKLSDRVFIVVGVSYLEGITSVVLICIHGTEANPTAYSFGLPGDVIGCLEAFLLIVPRSRARAMSMTLNARQASGTSFGRQEPQKETSRHQSARDNK